MTLGQRSQPNKVAPHPILSVPVLSTCPPLCLSAQGWISSPTSHTCCCTGLKFPTSCTGLWIQLLQVAPLSVHVQLHHAGTDSHIPMEGMVHTPMKCPDLCLHEVRVLCSVMGSTARPLGCRTKSQGCHFRLPSKVCCFLLCFCHLFISYC